jgi:hypothetical protein
MPHICSSALLILSVVTNNYASCHLIIPRGIFDLEEKTKIAVSN